MPKDRVLYLDVDDTLLMWNSKSKGVAAPFADMFVHWALEHFEVRWLTYWCPCGQMWPKRARELSYHFMQKVSFDTFLTIENSLSFMETKTDAIDLDDPRPFVWLEDEVLPRELDVLRGRNVLESYVACNVSVNCMNLKRAWKQIAERFQLPMPDLDYTTFNYKTYVEVGNWYVKQTLKV